MLPTMPRILGAAMLAVGTMAIAPRASAAPPPGGQGAQAPAPQDLSKAGPPVTGSMYNGNNTKAPNMASQQAASPAGEQSAHPSANGVNAGGNATTPNSGNSG